MGQGNEQAPLLVAAESEVQRLLKELAAIQAEQEQLAEREKDIRTKLARVSQTLITLADVYGGWDLANRVNALLSEEWQLSKNQPGLTDSVKKALEFRYPNWLPPMVVRHYVESRGTEVKGENPMAMVHQALRRLVEQEWAEIDQLADGSKVYRQRRIGTAARAGKVESSPSVVTTTSAPMPRYRSSRGADFEKKKM